jgi:hypothetical protein
MRVAARLLAAIAAPAALAAIAFAAAACGPPPDAKSARGALGDKWYERAKESYAAGDVEDATEAIRSALKASPDDVEVRVLGARLALMRLDFEEALKLTEGIETTDVHGIRGRAHWYGGDIESAADELEAMLGDPGVKDPWAREIARLARRGVGRKPFAMEGSVVAAVEMPRAGPMLVVPCELQGENVLALVATGQSEVVVDSSSRREAAWVNLRFGDAIEVKDVPALTQDLSGISRQLGAPIKALLGINLLRHLNVTFDRQGDQFIVRRNAPVAPPQATRVPLWYVRGGGMLLRADVSQRDDTRSLFLVDSAALFPLALNRETWSRAGVDPKNLRPEPGLPGNMKSGLVPFMRVGAFDFPQMPAVDAPGPLAEVAKNVDVSLGGIVGSGLLSLFRVTFGDDGRFVWLEAEPLALDEPPPPSSLPDPSLYPDVDIPPRPPAEPAPAKPEGPASPAPGAKPAKPPEPKPDGKPKAAPPPAGGGTGAAPSSAKPAGAPAAAGGKS